MQLLETLMSHVHLICEDKSMILDAKYKMNWESAVNIEHIHQVTTYMYILKLKQGGLVLPNPGGP